MYLYNKFQKDERRKQKNGKKLRYIKTRKLRFSSQSKFFVVALIIIYKGLEKPLKSRF